MTILPAPLIQPIQAFIVQAGARQGRWLGRDLQRRNSVAARPDVGSAFVQRSIALGSSCAGPFPVLTFNALLTMAKSKPKPKTQTYLVRASYESITAKRARSAKQIINKLQQSPQCVAGLAESEDGTDRDYFNRP